MFIKAPSPYPAWKCVGLWKEKGTVFTQKTVTQFCFLSDRDILEIQNSKFKSECCFKH